MNKKTQIAKKNSLMNSQNLDILAIIKLKITLKIL